MKTVKELNKITDEATKSVRATIDAIVDEMTFVECDKFIRSATCFGEATGEGVVSGFAKVNDIGVAIFAVNGETLKGGIGKANSDKIVKCVKNAVKTSSPLVAIVDTMGARFAEGIEVLEGYAAIYGAFAEAHNEIPVILVVNGNNYGMLSYLSAAADVTIVTEKSVVATSSPLILAAKNNTDTSVVGTAQMCASNGVAALVVKSDAELATAVKSVLDYLCEPIAQSTDDGNRVCKGLKVGAKVTKIIDEVFDKNSFTELYPQYGKEVLVGFARLDGIAVGVVANAEGETEGKLTPKAAKKIMRLVNLCSDMSMPVVNVVNGSGAADCIKCQGELIDEIGRLICTYVNAPVAKVALITGKAIGLTYVAQCSKTVSDYTIAWEGATIGVMDNVAAAELVYADRIAVAKDKETALTTLAKEYGEENTSAVTVAEKGYIDNVINPNFSRQYLIAAVQAFVCKG